MRVLVMFDLPVKKKAEKQHYVRFRKFLLEDGYSMMQFSIYGRVTNGLDGVDKHIRRLKANLPPKGSVRAMTITEKQYAAMLFLVGSPSEQEKTVGAQLEMWL
jgi:CRISPR-associated protein Cas2